MRARSRGGFACAVGADDGGVFSGGKVERVDGKQGFAFDGNVKIADLECGLHDEAHRFAYQVRHLLLYVKRLAVDSFQYKDQAAVANSLSRMPTGTA